jgi:hypothetical protein
MRMLRITWGVGQYVRGEAAVHVPVARWHYYQQCKTYLAKPHPCVAVHKQWSLVGCIECKETVLITDLLLNGCHLPGQASND